jgi:HK97 family phage portal protein
MVAQRVHGQTREHPVFTRNREIVARRNAEVEKRSGVPLNSERAFEVLVGSTTASGASVNASTALGVPAVTACVGLLADMVALLPLKLYLKTAAGDVEESSHPAARVVARPGDLHTGFEFRQLVMTGVGLGGNGYARVHRASNGAPGELEWLKPVDVCPQRNLGDRFVNYRVAGVARTLTRFDLIHTRGLSRDGISGMSPITQLRESIGLSIAQREQAGKLAKNGARFPGILSTPASLNPDQLKDARAEWQRNQAGTDNTGKTAILHGAWSYAATNGMTMADAEFLESRRFELQEIARLYRIPPFLIGDTTANTSWGSGIEQQNLGFLAYSLNPWLRTFEESFDYTLLTSDEQAAGLHFVFDREEIGAVSLQAQSQFIASMRTAGVFSPNDGREWLGYQRVALAGMDDYRAPLNSSSTGTPSTEEPAPTPAVST